MEAVQLMLAFSSIDITLSAYAPGSLFDDNLSIHASHLPKTSVTLSTS